MQTDTETERARWAAAFADRLAGFEPAPYPDVPEEVPTYPSAHLTTPQENARKRAQKSRDKARRAYELDSAIADGLRGILRQRKVFERMRDGENFTDMAVRIEPIFAKAMETLVEEHGWERPLASRTLTARLLRPAKPPPA